MGNGACAHRRKAESAIRADAFAGPMYPIEMAKGAGFPGMVRKHTLHVSRDRRRDGEGARQCINAYHVKLITVVETCFVV